MDQEAERRRLQRKTIVELKELARDRLIIVSRPEMGTEKQHLIQSLIDNKTDYSKLGIDRLRDYIREHHLLMPSADDPKVRYIEIIEKEIKPEERKLVTRVIDSAPRYDRDLWYNFLLRTHPSIAFRVGGLLKISSSILLSEQYWRERCLIEGLPVSNTKGGDPRTEYANDPKIKPWRMNKGISWRLWYLEWMRFPIASDYVLGEGDNSFGQLGFISRKSKIEELTEAEINKVTDIQKGSNLTLFLRDDDSVWSCGLGSMGWGKQYSALQKKVKHAPHQIEGLTGVKMVLITRSGEIIVLLRTGEIYRVTLKEIGIEKLKLSELRYSAITPAYTTLQYLPYPLFHALRFDGVMDIYQMISGPGGTRLIYRMDGHNEKPYPSPPATQTHDPRMFIIDYRHPFPDHHLLRTIEYKK